MEFTYVCTVKSNDGAYSIYNKTFRDDAHFTDWYNKVCKHGKVIGVDYPEDKQSKTE